MDTRKTLPNSLSGTKYYRQLKLASVGQGGSWSDTDTPFKHWTLATFALGSLTDYALSPITCSESHFRSKDNCTQMDYKKNAKSLSTLSGYWMLDPDYVTLLDRDTSVNKYLQGQWTRLLLIINSSNVYASLFFCRRTKCYEYEDAKIREAKSNDLPNHHWHLLMGHESFNFFNLQIYKKLSAPEFKSDFRFGFMQHVNPGVAYFDLVNGIDHHAVAYVGTICPITNSDLLYDIKAKDKAFTNPEKYPAYDFLKKSLQESIDRSVIQMYSNWDFTTHTFKPRDKWGDREKSVGSVKCSALDLFKPKPVDNKYKSFNLGSDNDTADESEVFQPPAAKRKRTHIMKNGKPFILRPSIVHIAEMDKEKKISLRNLLTSNTRQALNDRIEEIKIGPIPGTNSPKSVTFVDIPTSPISAPASPVTASIQLPDIGTVVDVTDLIATTSMDMDSATQPQSVDFLTMFNEDFDFQVQN